MLQRVCHDSDAHPFMQEPASPAMAGAETELRVTNHSLWLDGLGGVGWWAAFQGASRVAAVAGGSLVRRLRPDAAVAAPGPLKRLTHA